MLRFSEIKPLFVDLSFDDKSFSFSWIVWSCLSTGLPHLQACRKNAHLSPLDDDPFSSSLFFLTFFLHFFFKLFFLHFFFYTFFLHFYKWDAIGLPLEVKVRKNLTTRKSFCNVLDNATMATVHQLSLPTTPPLRYISPKHADPEKKIA